MSISILLVPAALSMIAGAAATAAFNAKFGTAVKAAENTVCYETHFTDKELLISALEKNGFQLTDNDGHIIVSLNDNLILFHKNETGTFNAYVDSKVPQEQVMPFFESLQTSYTSALQERLYHQVLDRAQENGMKLEKEIIHDDNSIELVLRVED
jgi:hypothetical protein